jgi:hypothetical protein
VALDVSSIFKTQTCLFIDLTDDSALAVRARQGNALCFPIAVYMLAIYPHLSYVSIYKYTELTYALMAVPRMTERTTIPNRVAKLLQV